VFTAQTPFKNSPKYIKLVFTLSDIDLSVWVGWRNHPLDHRSTKIAPISYIHL
jgi:hypothetical protein